MKDYSHHFRELLEPQLPADSRILTPGGGGDLMILATWRLKGDPQRPSKLSRMIRIVTCREALDVYARGSDGVRLASDQRFIAWLQAKLPSFDPHHDAPLGVDPTPVTWTLGTIELNA